MLKAVQHDTEAIEEYPLEVKVIILPGYPPSKRWSFGWTLPYAELWDTAARSSWL